MTSDIEDQDNLVQYFCRGCFGESWLRIPFAPRFCAHCGVQFLGDRIQITEMEQQNGA
jgi:hypothetical protein